MKEPEGDKIRSSNEISVLEKKKAETFSFVFPENLLIYFAY